VDNIIKAGCVSLTPAALMGWAKQSVWPAIYAAAEMSMPTERIRLMKQKKGGGRLPYFSSGLFSFPEQYRTPDGKSFPQVWMEVAQTLDAADLPAKRPYLDQMSLPLAIQKSGLRWNLLPDAQHFILGGKARGEPLPSDRDIYAVHYRQWALIKELGLTAYAKQVLTAHAGIKKVALVDEADPGPKSLRQQHRTEKQLARREQAPVSDEPLAPSDKASAKAARKARKLARIEPAIASVDLGRQADEAAAKAARKARNLDRARKKAAAPEAKSEAAE
jgi:hypothetical protein